MREIEPATGYLDIYPHGYFRETLVMFSFFPRAENATGLIGLHSENRRTRDARASQRVSNVAATFVKRSGSPIAFLLPGLVSF